ncbi:MAG: phage major capsid protein [Phyllobacteriaceae bacterium]|nr:phage major capsid protein [Phyllobacteriaceae bacterium]
MLKTHEIQEKRARLIDAGKAIETRAKDAKREALTAEETADLDRIASEIEALNGEERRARIFEEAERRAEAEPVAGGRDTLADVERRFSIGRALADFSERGRLTGAEAEWNAENRSGRPGAINVPTSILLETRAATVGGSAGNLVATDLGPTIDRLRPMLAIQKLGATVISGLTSFLDLPRMTGSGSVGWVAEGGAATRSDVAFDKVSLAPRTITGEYEMSRRMMIQAPAIEQILRKDLGWLIAQALDSAAIQGGGTNEPTGILANADVPVVAMGTNGAALDLDVVPNMIRALDLANCDETSLAFLTNNKVKAAAMKMKDTTGKFYGISGVFQNEPVTFTNQVPSDLTKGTGTGLSAMIYGGWADLVLAYWSGVDILLNPYHSDVASKGGALLHAFLDTDIAFRHPECFVVAKDIIA